MATLCSSSRCVASTTTPIPPSPRTRLTRYLPTRSWGAGDWSETSVGTACGADGSVVAVAVSIALVGANPVLAVEVRPAVHFHHAPLTERAFLARAAAVDVGLVAVLHAVVAARTTRGGAVGVIAGAILIGHAGDAAPGAVADRAAAFRAGGVGRRDGAAADPDDAGSESADGVHAGASRGVGAAAAGCARSRALGAAARSC